MRRDVTVSECERDELEQEERECEHGERWTQVAKRGCCGRLTLNPPPTRRSLDSRTHLQSCKAESRPPAPCALHRSCGASESASRDTRGTFILRIPVLSSSYFVEFAPLCCAASTGGARDTCSLSPVVAGPRAGRGVADTLACEYLLVFGPMAGERTSPDLPVGQIASREATHQGGHVVLDQVSSRARFLISWPIISGSPFDATHHSPSVLRGAQGAAVARAGIALTARLAEWLRSERNSSGCRSQFRILHHRQHAKVARAHLTSLHRSADI